MNENQLLQNDVLTNGKAVVANNMEKQPNSPIETFEKNDSNSIGLNIRKCFCRELNDLTFINSIIFNDQHGILSTDSINSPQNRSPKPEKTDEPK